MVHFYMGTKGPENVSSAALYVYFITTKFRVVIYLT